jgi:hypothetical protein
MARRPWLRRRRCARQVITALLSAVLQAEGVAEVAAGLVGEHCPTDAGAAGVDPAAPAAAAGRRIPLVHFAR